MTVPPQGGGWTRGGGGVQLPIKDMGHFPHTSGGLSPNNFSGSIIGVTRIITRRRGLFNAIILIGILPRTRIRIRT